MTDVSRITDAQSIAKLIGQEQAVWAEVRQRFIAGPVELTNKKSHESASLIKAIVDNMDIYEPIPVYSHRKSIGRLIVFVKSSMMQIMKPIIKICFGRQLAINENFLTVATMVTEMQTKVADLQDRVNKLEEKSSK
jgi:hypothetical protein